MGFGLRFLHRGCANVVQRKRITMDRAVDQMNDAAFPVVSVFKQALETFGPKRNIADFDANMQKLKRMMDRLTANDVNLDQIFLKADTWEKPDKAPCTYVELFSNEHMNMSMFILRPGFKMPLHDHPKMHGLLKVISGAVNLRSFSEYSETPPIAPQSGRKVIFAEVKTDSTFKEDSEACVLTPDQSNFHEIEALHLPAAFLDILAPPYDTIIENNGPRRCTYYRVKDEISTNLVRLEEIRSPSWFYCDQAPYLGPLLI